MQSEPLKRVWVRLRVRFTTAVQFRLTLTPHAMRYSLLRPMQTLSLQIFSKFTAVSAWSVPGRPLRSLMRYLLLLNREEITVTKLPTVRFLRISKRPYLIEKIGRGERI